MTLCKEKGVSESVFHAWKNFPDSGRASEEHNLKSNVSEAFKDAVKLMGAQESKLS